MEGLGEWFQDDDSSTLHLLCNFCSLIIITSAPPDHLPQIPEVGEPLLYSIGLIIKKKKKKNNSSPVITLPAFFQPLHILKDSFNPGVSNATFRINAPEALVPFCDARSSLSFQARELGILLKP